MLPVKFVPEFTNEVQEIVWSWTCSLAWLADLEAQQDAKAATLFAIESLPGANRYSQQENRVHGQGWTAQVNGGESIDLTIRGLTRAQALVVLAALPTA